MIDVERSKEEPTSLAAAASYAGIDVINALHASFLGKCYLCETCLEPGTLDVDHRKPKAKDEFPALEFAWTNLFPTCKQYECNGRRQRKYPEGGLLDPSANQQVEHRIRQSIVSSVSGVLRGDVICHFEPVHADDVAARNTAAELDRIHHGRGSTERAKLSARALRKNIEKQIILVGNAVREYVALPADGNRRREQLQNELRAYFSRRAPYTMVVRSYFSHRLEIRALFEDSP